MTRAEILAFFPPAGVLGSPNLGGLEYAVPTLAWLQGPFWDFFKGRYWSTNSDKWKFRWECRDFARAYACAAQECWGDTAGGDPAVDALAVGEMWFHPDTATGHAICPVITENGLQFIEPQTGLLCTVTPEQFSSRYFCRW